MAASQPPLTNEDGTSPRALVVDDEPAIRELYSEVLRDMGFDVDVAQDGQEGLDYLRAAFYSVIISDLRMPRVGGFEFWDRSEGARPGAGKRFIFTTGYMDFLDTKEYDLVNGHPCIEKPASIEQIQTTVSNLMRDVGLGTD